MRPGRRVGVAATIVALAAAGSLAWAAGAGADSVGRANLDGSGIVPSLIGVSGAGYSDMALRYGVGIAVDGGHVYWSNPVAHTIERANLDGSGVEPAFIRVPLVDGASSGPGSLVVSSGQIYWTTVGYPPGPFPPSFSFIGRANLDGSGVVPRLITGGEIGGLAANDAHIYWADASEKAIGRASLGGSGAAPKFIATGEGVVAGMAVDATHIYWTSYCILPCRGSTIGRANLDGSGVQPRFITDAVFPATLAVSGGYIFWTKRDPPLGIVPFQTADTIGRANLDGSGVQNNMITLGWDYLGSIALDGTNIYWTSAPRPTSATRLNCSPGEVMPGRSTACTATVSDVSPTPRTPTGTVTFTTDRAGTFNATSCTLSGSGTSASCQVRYTPTARVFYPTITASYRGDSAHTASTASTTIGVFVIPQITKVSQSARRWRRGSALPRYARATPPVGTTFTFTIDLPYAPVRFDLIHTVPGRLIGGNCVASTARNRGKPGCRRSVTAATLRHEWSREGLKRLHFEGRINRRRWLAPGAYTLKITATAAGRSSRPAFLHFTILR